MVTSLRSQRQSGDVVGLLDVGTSKTACLIIARPVAGRGFESVGVRGVGHEPSRGLKAGAVFDPDAVEESVRGAVARAERAAGVAVEQVFLAVSCGRLKSSTFAADTRIEGRVVAHADMERLTQAGRTFAERDGRTLLHLNCLSYRLDDAVGIADPRGLAGADLSADLHAVTADSAALGSLLDVIERTYLATIGLAPAPYASSLAATTAQERHAGVIAIDMGAGTTSVSAFAAGHLLMTEVLALGGNQITHDIAKALGTTFAEAERIKKEYGTLARVAANDHAPIPCQLAEEQTSAPRRASRALVHEIVAGRVAGLLGHVAERIEASGFARHVRERIVLTGGASQLAGLGEFAAQVLARPARVARIRPAGGLPESVCSPALSTVTGLVHVVLDPTAGVRWDRGEAVAGSYLKRMGQWLQESF